MKRSNDTLENSLLSSCMHSSDIGICVFDHTLRVVLLNPAACHLFNIDGVAALNQPVLTLLKNADDSTGLIAWLTDSSSSGERLVVLTQTGNSKHLLLKSRITKSGRGESYKMLSITDVTQLIAAQVLQDQHRQWQALNAGVVVSDACAPNMPIVFVNSMFERMSGYSQAEIVGKNCQFLQGSDTNQPALQSIRDAIRGETNGFALLRNYRKDGTLFMNELFVSPIRNNAGKVTHFVGIQHLVDQASRI